MPEHLRALVVILAFSSVVFLFAKAPATAIAMTPSDFERRRNLWLAITLLAFLAHNFWIFIFVAAILLVISAQRDDNKVALVLFLLLALPPMYAEIPGFGGIRYFFAIDYLKLLFLVVLLPLFIREVTKHALGTFFQGVSDWLLFCYLALNVVLLSFASTVTGTLRTSFLLFLSAFLPYAIASRFAKDASALRAALMSYIVGAVVLACIGIFEISRKWLLYAALDDALGLRWEFGGHYLMRDEVVRATGTAGQPIPFGYAMAVGLLLMLGARRMIPQKTLWAGGLALLALGMISSWSRGPWLGAAVGIFAFALTGQHKARNAIYLAAGACVVAAIAIVSPLGDKLLHSVTVDEGSYTYRQRLLEVSFQVILANPAFGAYDIIYSPAMQDLKQGQGIVDIVNTYAGIGLSSGLVGLSLFIGFFGVIVRGVWRRFNLAETDDVRDMGRGMFAALICILVTIFTVSSITVIPVIYYLMAGLAAAYARGGRLALVQSAHGIPQIAAKVRGI